jgi:hypothetical protein
MKRLFLAVLAGTITLATVGQEGAIASTFSIREITSEIKQRIDFPIMLPSADVVERYKFNPDETIYSHTSYGEGGYRVYFNNRPGNPGNAALRFVISADPGKDLERTDHDEPNPNYRPKYSQIKLSNGSAALQTLQCGGTACWSSVAWKSNNVRYSVVAKQRNPEGSIAIANSMVKTGDRSQGTSTLSTFNAEIFSPPTNCRVKPSLDASVQQSLKRGDVLVDIDNTKTDGRGRIWYQEKYLGCWIHQSQLRFK